MLENRELVETSLTAVLFTSVRILVGMGLVSHVSLLKGYKWEGSQGLLGKLLPLIMENEQDDAVK